MTNTKFTRPITKILKSIHHKPPPSSDRPKSLKRIVLQGQRANRTLRSVGPSILSKVLLLFTSPFPSLSRILHLNVMSLPRTSHRTICRGMLPFRHQRIACLSRLSLMHKKRIGIRAGGGEGDKIPLYLFCPYLLILFLLPLLPFQ